MAMTERGKSEGQPVEGLPLPPTNPTGSRRWSRLGSALRSIDVFAVSGLILLLFVWWILTFWVPVSSLPSPLSVLRRIAKDFLVIEEFAYYGLPDTGLLSSMYYTAANVFIAVALGGVIGTVLGLATALVPILRAVLDPILNTVGTIPILVMAPFFLIWFGTGNWSALLLVTIYVLVILYIFAQRAAENLDPVYEDFSRTLGGNAFDTIRDVLIPGTLPEVLGGLRIALASAWGLEAIAELLGSQRGIGKLIELFSGSLDIEGIFSALIVLGAVALLADYLFSSIMNYITRWQILAQIGEK